jgi:hypothetical protein
VLAALKFNVASPGTVIPGATYALFVQGAFPAGFTSPEVPSWLAVPPGNELWAVSTTDGAGHLAFLLPSGHAWCLREIGVPSGYVLDDGLHCTSVLISTTPSGSTVALPELAATGAPLTRLGGAGVLLFSMGLALRRLIRRRAH